MGTVYSFLYLFMTCDVIHIEGLYSSHESGENMCGMTAGSSVRNEQTALLVSVDHHTHTHSQHADWRHIISQHELGWGGFCASKLVDGCAGTSLPGQPADPPNVGCRTLGSQLAPAPTPDG